MLLSCDDNCGPWLHRRTTASTSQRILYKSGTYVNNVASAIAPGACVTHCAFPWACTRQKYRSLEGFGSSSFQEFLLRQALPQTAVILHKQFSRTCRRLWSCAVAQTALLTATSWSRGVKHDGSQRQEDVRHRRRRHPRSSEDVAERPATMRHPPRPRNIKSDCYCHS